MVTLLYILLNAVEEHELELRTSRSRSVMGVARALDSDCLQVRTPFGIIHLSQKSILAWEGIITSEGIGSFRTP